MSQSPLPKSPPKVHDFKARFGVEPDPPPKPKMTRLQARRVKRKRMRAGMVAFAVMLGVAGGTAFLIGQDYQGFAALFSSAVASARTTASGEAQKTAEAASTPLKKSSTAESPVLLPEPAQVPVQAAAPPPPPVPVSPPVPVQEVAETPPPPEPAPAVAQAVAEAPPGAAPAGENAAADGTVAAAEAPPDPPPPQPEAAEQPAPVVVAAAPVQAVPPPQPVTENVAFPATPIVNADGSNTVTVTTSEQTADAESMAQAVPEPDGSAVAPAAPETQVAMAVPQAEPVATVLKPADGAPFVQGQVFRDCENCPDLVVVVPPAGLPAEQVGRVKRPAGAPPLTAYAIGRFEVTFDDWGRCMAGGGCTDVPSDEGWGRNTRPVINVSHEAAVSQYIAWLSKATGATYRLPTASEWDFAEAGGGVMPATGLPLIDAQTICASGNYVAGAGGADEAGCADGFPTTAPAGSLKANALGLHDMRGNVWEWVDDCWTPGFTYKVKDSERDCRKRLLRGGSWSSRATLSAMPARGFEDAKRATRSIGFRVARALP